MSLKFIEIRSAVDGQRVGDAERLRLIADIRGGVVVDG